MSPSAKEVIALSLRITDAKTRRLAAAEEEKGLTEQLEVLLGVRETVGGPMVDELTNPASAPVLPSLPKTRARRMPAIEPVPEADPFGEAKVEP